MSYLVSDVYNPAAEHGIDPLDPDVGLAFPDDADLVLSPKDTEAPGLAEAAESGLLPRWNDLRAYYGELNR